MMFTFYIFMAILMIVIIAVVVSTAIAAYFHDGQWFPTRALLVQFIMIILFGTFMAHNAFRNAIDEKIKNGVTYECTRRDEGTVCRADPGN